MHFKTQVSKHAVILEKHLKNPLIVRESRAAQSTLMLTKYDFCQEKITFQYCLFWATVIIANCILERFEDEASSHVEETQFVAENICKSMEYLHHLKPVGVPSLTFLVSMAFGVSSTGRRALLVKEMKGLFETLPVDIEPCRMEYVFSFVPGRLVP